MLNGSIWLDTSDWNGGAQVSLLSMASVDPRNLYIYIYMTPYQSVIESFSRNMHGGWGEWLQVRTSSCSTCFALDDLTD